MVMIMVIMMVIMCRVRKDGEITNNFSGVGLSGVVRVSDSKL